MEQEASFFGECRLDRTIRSIHDRLVGRDPRLTSGRSFGWRRSRRWMAGMKRRGELSGDASMVTVVADWEACIHGMSASCPGSVQVLARASHDRVVEGETIVMENSDRSSCCGDCTDSGLSGLDMTREDLYESSSVPP